MSSKKKVRSLYTKLKLEAAVKSLLVGLVAGGIAGLIAAVVFWFLDLNGVALSVLCFVGVLILASVMAYLLRFRTTTKRDATRLDSYGLQERVITMLELEGNDSFIAQRQRQDAKENLEKLDPSVIKFRFSTKVIAFAVVFVILFAGMTTVEQLSTTGTLPSGMDVWQIFFPPTPPEQYTILYAVESGGYIEGETEQTVFIGESSARVVAVADEGYVFTSWSDGEENPSRIEVNVARDMTVYAIFSPIDDMSDHADDDDVPDDVPEEAGGMPGSSNIVGGIASGKYVQTNQIIDGQTYYRDVYEDFYNRAMEYLENGKTIPAEIRAVIEAYYKIIQ